jgi:hypothetical protein
VVSGSSLAGPAHPGARAVRPRRRAPGRAFIVNLAIKRSRDPRPKILEVHPPKFPTVKSLFFCNAFSGSPLLAVIRECAACCTVQDMPTAGEGKLH